MRRGLPSAIGVATLIVLLVGAGPAPAAKRCAAPATGWERATPAEAGMDAEKLADAVDYGTTNSAFAVRVFRHGCLVGEDRLADQNRGTSYESWSLGKSVTALLFGAAMTNGDISPKDRVGSLLPEADAEHGAIKMRDLLTMTSGLHWNGFRDYNVFTQEDRVRDALTLPVDHRPGTYFEYAQSAVALLPKAVERATGRDPREYMQTELLDALGIEAETWDWQRDGQGNIEAFYGTRMTPDDYGKLGELMRRGGTWRGERLLSKEFVRKAITPKPTNGCYGWLIWINSAKPCIGATISDRSVVDEYGYPNVPRDAFVYSGLFGQIVATFPSQGVVIVRTGQDSPTTFAGATAWQIELFRRVLLSITDEPVDLPQDPDPEYREDADHNFGTALFDPGSYSKGAVPDPLPPAGPARARAPRLERGGKGIRGRRAFVRVHCRPAPEGALQSCGGKVNGKGVRAVRYAIDSGVSERIGVPLRPRSLKRLVARGKLRLRLNARNRDSLGGTKVSESLAYVDAAERPRRGLR